MIRDSDTFDRGTMHSGFSSGPMAAPAAAEFPPGDGASPELEITRLTWNVLDGSASLADRQRLAELVNAQHAVRRRLDR